MRHSKRAQNGIKQFSILLVESFRVILLASFVTVLVKVFVEVNLSLMNLKQNSSNQQFCRVFGLRVPYGSISAINGCKTWTLCLRQVKMSPVFLDHCCFLARQSLTRETKEIYST